MIVTIDHTALPDGLKAGGLDTGTPITAGEARRLACNAGLLPAVLGTQSQVLDLGRQQRLFTEPQRLAAGVEHQHCAADGCDRPFAWCELHHLKAWAKGGTTNQRDAVPLCHWHHRRIHDPAHQHTRLPDGSLRFTRRT